MVISGFTKENAQKWISISSTSRLKMQNLLYGLNLKYSFQIRYRSKPSHPWRSISTEYVERKKNTDVNVVWLYLSRRLNFRQRNRLSSIHRLIQYPNNVKIKDAGAFAASQKRKTQDVYVNHYTQSLAAHQPINSRAFLFIWLCKQLRIADSQQVKQKKAKPKGKNKRPKKSNSRKKGAGSIWQFQSPSETIFTCHSGGGEHGSRACAQVWFPKPVSFSSVTWLRREKNNDDEEKIVQWYKGFLMVYQPFHFLRLQFVSTYAQ